VLAAAPAHADDLITVLVNGAVNPTVPPTSTVQIDNIFTGGMNGENTIHWIAVGTPGGQIYIFVPPLGYIDFFGGSGTSGGSADCVVPFGGPGSMSHGTPTGTASQLGCLVIASNPLWKLDATAETASQLEADCDATTTPTTTGSASDGDTSQSGTYGVMTCWANFPITTTFFSAVQLFRVPEFGSLALVLAIGVVGLVLVRRRLVPQTPQLM
jgi:hypothetical protein